jgi:hypothetical protein
MSGLGATPDEVMDALRDEIHERDTRTAELERQFGKARPIIRDAIHLLQWSRARLPRDKEYAAIGLTLEALRNWLAATPEGTDE